MLVEDVMSTDLVTCPVTAPLQEGVERMLENRVGSVIIRDEEAPVGIVTETDVLHAGYVTKRPFTEIPIRKVMSNPLHTVQPTKTLRRATRRMRQENVKKLVVTADLQPVGIVTAQDVIENYHDIRAEIHDLARSDHTRRLDASAFDLNDA
ncbi:MAG: CBS domain-containing protein [Halorubrum sp.]